MITIKSFSVGNGDMFYINHANKTLTIIDCNIIEESEEYIINEIKEIYKKKDLNRFISTHPDKDHITGIKLFDEEIGINNFYFVENKIQTENSDDFKKYYELRNNSKLKLEKNMSNYWLNKTNNERTSSGIFILWPNKDNKDFKDEKEKLENNEKVSANNISPIIEYSLKEGITALWFGDMENDFLEKIIDDVKLPKADIIFAPHHGRDTGKIPKDILDKIDPKLIIIGEAKPDHLNYYDGFDTITQNTAKNIVLKCETGKIHIYTTNKIDSDFLEKENVSDQLSTGEIYIGSLNLN